MKRKQWITALSAAALLFTAGCSRSTEPETQQLPDRQNVQQETGQTPQDSHTGADGTESVSQPGDDSLFSSQETYRWEEITISIPDLWKGKYQVEENENGFTLVQTASREKESGMGMLCGFYREDGMLIDIPGITPLAFTDTQTYYMVVPTDVSYYYEDETIAEEYRDMHELVHSVASTVTIDKEGVKENPEEYVLPLSDTVLLKEDDLYNFSGNELFIARNEIYARHGREFTNAYLNLYFQSLSWYEGTVPPDAFDEAVLSPTEQENIKQIKKAEEAYLAEHPFPREYPAGNTVSVDIDGDGVTEQLQYLPQEGDAALLIDGEQFLLSGCGIRLVNPHPEVFYITDISPYEDGLEIAVPDYGSDDNPATYFFIYNGNLTCIGSVGGFPFPELSGYNGFTIPSLVTGEIQLRFPYSCRAYDTWWYQSDLQTLTYNGSGYYSLIPDGPHRLSEDVTVYLEMDETHLKTILPAQDEVFFLETDGKEWVLLKGKDNTKGYLHIADGAIEENAGTLSDVFPDLTSAGGF